MQKTYERAPRSTYGHTRINTLCLYWFRILTFNISSRKSMLKTTITTYLIISSPQLVKFPSKLNSTNRNFLIGTSTSELLVCDIWKFNKLLGLQIRTQFIKEPANVVSCAHRMIDNFSNNDTETAFFVAADKPYEALPILREFLSPNLLYIEGNVSRSSVKEIRY